jgi:hypothetical protein
MLVQFLATQKEKRTLQLPRSTLTPPASPSPAHRPLVTTLQVGGKRVQKYENILHYLLVMWVVVHISLVIIVHAQLHGYKYPRNTIIKVVPGMDMFSRFWLRRVTQFISRFAFAILRHSPSVASSPGSSMTSNVSLYH